jgi:hypothetical protein
MTSPGKAPLPALAITHTTGQYAGGHLRDPVWVCLANGTSLCQGVGGREVSVLWIMVW